MKSNIPKVLYPLCGKPLIRYMLNTAKSLAAEKIILVIGYGKETVKESINDNDIKFVEQDPPIGTGDAVLRTEATLSEFNGNVLILAGDVPLLERNTIEELLKVHNKEKATATILTVDLKDPKSYGRIVRKGNEVVKIVEHKDAKLKEREIKEINTGIYIFEKNALFEALKKIRPDNVQKEHYLTDTIDIIKEMGGYISAYKTNNPEAVAGINTRKDLAEIEKILQAKIIEEHQLAGVTVKDPASTKIDADVEIGKDTVIYPYSSILGKTTIGECCSIGPNAVIINSRISDNNRIGEFTRIEGANL
jgi:bifunctional UDP-N-acetylglucosamine pyrophosphorylase/glucosamine-1-phosphate N-acetyltransferase